MNADELAPGVLVVDDDEVFIQMVCTYLRLQGIAALATTDSMQALDLLLDSADRVRLILVDLAMPDLDGFELAGMFRREPRVAHLPVIAVSARSSPEIDAEIAAAGIDRLLRKPFNMHTLRALLVEFELLDS